VDQRSEMKIFDPRNVVDDKYEGFLYIASPYSKANEQLRQDRYMGICATCAYFIKYDWTVYSPIAHWHPIASRFGLPEGMDFWRQHDLTMLYASCKMIVAMIQGWKDSDGIKEEIEFAKRRNIPVEYFDTEALRV